MTEYRKQGTQDPPALYKPRRGKQRTKDKRQKPDGRCQISELGRQRLLIWDWDFGLGIDGA